MGTDTPLLPTTGQVSGPSVSSVVASPMSPLWPLSEKSNLGLTSGTHCSEAHCAISVIFTGRPPGDVPYPDMEGQVVPPENKEVAGM